MPRPGTRRPFTVTTTITVLRVPAPLDGGDRDGADPIPDPEPIATAIPASIGQARGREDRDGGSRQVTVTRLVCDVTDLLHTDLVLDETTGITWALGTVVTDVRLNLNYMTADVARVSGVV